MKNNSPNNKLRSFKLTTSPVKKVTNVYRQTGHNEITQSKIVVRGDIATSLNQQDRYYQAPIGQEGFIVWKSGLEVPSINIELHEKGKKRKIKDLQNGFVSAGTDINRD